MITPRYKKWDDRNGQWIFGVSHQDLEKIRNGYGCSRCLEDFHGVFLEKCPVCGSPTQALITETPKEWK